MSLQPNALYYGDCLEWLPRFPLGVTRRRAVHHGGADSRGGSPRRSAEAGKPDTHGDRYPREQLWSVSDYFDDRMPAAPPLADRYTGKPIQPSIQMETSRV